MKLFLITFSIVSIMFLSVLILIYYVESKFPDEIQDVAPEDIQLLINRARISGDLSLEAILHVVKASLMDGTLKELQNYTTKYGTHALKEHYKKSKKSIKKLNMI